MATLADRLAELLEADMETMSARETVDHIAELERVRHQIEAEALARLRRFELSGAFDVDAARTPTSWLVEQTGVARTEAAGRMRLAGYLPQMPLTAAALAAGRITPSHARVLSRCVANPRVRPFFTEVEEDKLLEEAERLPADELAHRVARWIDLMDQDGAEPCDPDDDVVHVNRVGDRVKLSGDFGLATGVPLLAAIEERSRQLFHRDKEAAAVNPDDRLGMRTPGERRAEALSDLVRLGGSDRSNPAHRDPLFIVHVDWETWDEGLHAESVIELFDGSPIPFDVMRRLRCGARFQELVRSASGAVLHLGREQRYANREIRRSLAARDRGCAVPGCTIPPELCDAHHVWWWDLEGITDVDTMILACRHHHRMIHARRLSVQMIDGVPFFSDEYGNELRRGRRRPPPEAPAA